jgi:hypothetical protein
MPRQHFLGLPAIIGAGFRENGEQMGIEPSSYVSNVASHLQQLNEVRQQQVDVDLQVGESTRRVRQQVIDQSFQDLAKQGERVNEIKKTTLEARSGGGIDVWA